MLSSLDFLAKESLTKTIILPAVSGIMSEVQHFSFLD